MCEETRVWGRFYLGLVYSSCFAATLLTIYNKDRTKKLLNAIAYITAALSSTPGVIQLVYFTDELLVKSFALWPWAVGGIFYAGGGLIYALHFPERTFPQSRFIAIWM